jgi:hypothetical protein
MARKRLTAALVTAVALGSLAPAAIAQPDEPRLPKDAALVASTPSGARMFAFDEKRKLCVAFLGPREPRSFAYPACGRPTHGLRDLELDQTGYRHRSYHHGVVEPEVASIELVLSRGRTVRAETSAGAYTGRYAGKVRFVIAEVRNQGRAREPRYIRLFDAAGTLLALADTFGIDESVAGSPRELSRDTAGAARWSLRALRVRFLASLPGQIERFVEASCVDVRRLGRIEQRTIGSPQRSHARACVSPEGRRQSAYGFEQDCDLGAIATGIVPPGTRAVVAVLGDGSTRRVALRRLPAAQGGGRAFGIALGPRVALRRLVVVGKDGRRVVRRGAGPGSIRCSDEGFVGFFDGSEPAVPHGPAALTVYDDGVLLCATLGRPSAHPDECRYPPFALGDAWILTRSHGGRKLVAGIVPAEVVGAVVELHGGREIPMEPAPDGTYAGRYSSTLRLFTLEVDAEARIEEVQLFDARGRRADEYVYEAPPAVGPRRVVVGGPPGLRLRAQWRGSPRELLRSYLCISLGSGECTYGLTLGASVHADCNPRRLVLWGLLPRGRTAVTIETDRGDFRARVRRLPPALRQHVPARRRFLRQYLPAAAFVLALPPGAEPRALVVSGRRTSRKTLRLPPRLGAVRLRRLRVLGLSRRSRTSCAAAGGSPARPRGASAPCARPRRARSARARRRSSRP